MQRVQLVSTNTGPRYCTVMYHILDVHGDIITRRSVCLSLSLSLDFKKQSMNEWLWTFEFMLDLHNRVLWTLYWRGSMGPRWGWFFVNWTLNEWRRVVPVLKQRNCYRFRVGLLTSRNKQVIGPNLSWTVKCGLTHKWGKPTFHSVLLFSGVECPFLGWCATRFYDPGHKFAWLRSVENQDQTFGHRAATGWG